MNEEAELNLKMQLEQLDKAHERLYRTQGYSHEVERIRLLRELLCDQIQPRSKNNEDTDHSACALR